MGFVAGYRFLGGASGGNGGASVLNFNGGTLQATRSTASFPQNVGTANVRNGGATIAAGKLDIVRSPSAQVGYAVTIAQNLQHSAIAGDNVIDGGLTKTGIGTLTLTGTNTYTRSTNVSAGKLALGNANALQNSTLVTLIGSGTTTLLAGITNFDLGGLSGSGDLVLTDANGARATLLAGGNNASTIYSGNPTGVGGLNKVGAGTLTLIGVNAFQDTLRFDGGNFVMTGGGLSTGNAYVGDRASGNFLQSGGTFTPGNSNSRHQSHGRGERHVHPQRRYPDDGQHGRRRQPQRKYLYPEWHQSAHDRHTVSSDLLCGDRSGNYNLNGGTLAASNVTGGRGVSTFYFNGGTFQAGQDAPAFFQGLTIANVQLGGAKIDTASFNVTVAQRLVHSGTGTDGGLTKLGEGTLTLTGTNTYTGATSIHAGTLSIGNGGVDGTLGSGAENDAAVLAFNRSHAVPVASAI